jgi:hypothetical protein
MRIRTAIVAAALLLPSIATAQRRVPGIEGRRPIGDPGRRMPDGRQPEVIKRSQAFVRSRYSVEAYPLISRVVASGAVPGSSGTSWTSVGTGTRLDWRQTDNLSWTIDLTASYLGGQAVTETAEVGTRIRSHGWNERVRPFADLRVGFQHMSQSLTNDDLGFGPGSFRTSPMRYGRGVGALAGAGIEYYLTNTLGLTTGVSVMRSSMRAYDFSGVTTPAADKSFSLTTYRLAVGLRYNWVRYLNPATTPTP